jgi:phosphoribosylamine-glycine ligase
VWGVTPENRYNIHPAEMKLGTAPAEVGGNIEEEAMMVTAGDYVLITTGTGKTVQAAKKRAYGVLKELEIPNSPMYRTDIGDRLEKQLPKLQDLGFAESWEF